MAIFQVDDQALLYKSAIPTHAFRDSGKLKLYLTPLPTTTNGATTEGGHLDSALRPHRKPLQCLAHVGHPQVTSTWSKTGHLQHGDQTQRQEHPHLKSAPHANADCEPGDYICGHPSARS
ncbi:hypothetical protein H257_16911 [Aphanomyces astaci]|uniref:Ig-like domain-containing protein n=1 Tax=Aphanomyces astaci TaxID=112090 RepID=W4FIP3_APHAT|nr:hypothetical protein H257_16911 [Aphanomyces astaci]ETV66701.1 hypothetical protein H257_16911 [Aphanomyces astaci]|eukprot:XP_009843826.1 hypothetical protein H257_16911 [Aphanomyces astaci]